MVYIQFSADQGKTWVDGPSEFLTTLLVSGLTPGVTYWFRFRAKVGKVMNDWSSHVEHLVK